MNQNYEGVETVVESWFGAEDGVKPCILVFSNGREHNMVVENIAGGYLLGTSAAIVHACLYTKNNERYPSLIFANSNVVNSESYGPNRKVYVDVPCMVRQKHPMLVNMSQVTLVEIIKFPYFDVDPRGVNGVLDEEVILDKVEILKEYHNGEKFTPIETMEILPPGVHPKNIITPNVLNEANASKIFKTSKKQ